jgi:molybdopterin molybdotransferase
LLDALKNGSRQQVLIITGGVSVGEHDLVKAALQSLGAKIDIWRVAIKPGKPFLFGRIGDCAVFGLPGNPVSAFVTFLIFVRPAILKMMGATDVDPLRVPARVDCDLNNEGDRAHYLRGNFENGEFSPVGRQESHAIFGLSQANALLRLAPGERIRRGTLLQCQLLD